MDQQQQEPRDTTTLWSGKRTGIRVQLEPEYDEYGMEDPAKVFAAAQPPRRLDLGSPTESLNVQVLKQTDFSIEVESVKTASPERGRDAPEDTVVEGDQDFPIEDDLPEDDLLPPPPPDDDDDDDVTESGEEVETANIDEENADADNTADDDKPKESETEDEEQPEDFSNHMDQNDDAMDDENEGAGFSMAESVVTPTSPNKRKRLKSKKKQVRIQTPDEETSTDEDESVVKPAKKKKKRSTNRFSTKVTPKGIPQARTFHEVPLSALQTRSDDDEDDDEKGVRRSSRVHIAPLEWWKGETYILGPNNFGDEYDGVTNMPVVKGIKKPDPTPYKKLSTRRDTSKTKSSKKSKGSKKRVEERVEIFDTFEVEKMYSVNEGESANLVNEYADEISRRKVVSRFQSQVHQDLPLPKGQRTKREGKKTGKATQCFNLVADAPGAPSFISGTLILPPKAIKDAESVLSNVQHFTVIDCQPNALEVAYADPRDDTNVVTDESAEHFLLDKADTFFVPAGNAYRLVNHSRSHEALISWMIVRNTAEEEEETYDDED